MTLEQVYAGASVNVSYTRQKKCGHCGGSGADAPADIETCSACRGTGFRTENNGFFVNRRPCAACHGTGKTIKHKCHVCAGKGTTAKAMRVPVAIPRGVRDGEVIRLGGLGNDAYQQATSNLQVTVRVRQHPVFTRKDNDLYASVTVTLLESLTGFQKELRLLDGTALTVSARKVTPHGHVFRFDGMGLPLTSRSARFGTLFVTVNVMFPESLSAQQIDGLAPSSHAQS